MGGEKKGAKRGIEISFGHFLCGKIDVEDAGDIR